MFVYRIYEQKTHISLSIQKSNANNIVLSHSSSGSNYFELSTTALLQMWRHFYLTVLQMYR